MSKSPKTSLRSSPSVATPVLTGQDVERQAPMQAEPAKPAAPLYEMVSDGQSAWHNLHDAAICFATNDALGIGTRVKDSPSSQPRPMTEEEKRRIFDLAMSLVDKH